MCQVDPPVVCQPTQDEAELASPAARRAIRDAFRDGIAYAVVMHGRDHELDDGERVGCYRCPRDLADGDRAFVLGIRAVCEPCSRAVTP